MVKRSIEHGADQPDETKAAEQEAAKKSVLDDALGLGISSAALKAIVEYQAEAIVEHLDPNTGETIPDPAADAEFTSDELPEEPHPDELRTDLTPDQRVRAIMGRGVHTSQNVW